VASLRYIEVFFILVNGAIQWLLVTPRSPNQRAADQMRAFAGEPTRKN